jgi:hypothetical protein
MKITPTPLNIGQVPQFFFDNHIIDMVNFVTRTMHRPNKHAPPSCAGASLGTGSLYP